MIGLKKMVNKVDWRTLFSWDTSSRIDRYDSLDEMLKNDGIKAYNEHLLKEKRQKEYETTPCSCANIDEMDVVEAVSVAHSSMLQSFCKENNIKCVHGGGPNVGGHISCSLILVVDHIEYKIEYSYSLYESFVKCACITCGTCLGWCSTRVKDRQYNMKTPYERIQKKIDDQIGLVRAEVLKKARAREICNVQSRTDT